MDLRKHVRTRLVSGLLVLVPLALTLFLLHFLYKAFSGVIVPLLRPVSGDLPHYAVVVMGLLGTALVVYVIGLVTTHFVGQRLLRFGESIILRVPIAKSIYSARKQIVSLLAAGNSAAFKAVVVVVFPRLGTLGVGFATGRIHDEFGRLHYTIFIPTTPNPTSGFLLLVPEKDVKFTTLTIEEGIKMIVSGGVLSPERFGVASAQVMDAPPPPSPPT